MITTYLWARRWATLFGYGLFVGMLATGYLYNLTFVQLGLPDLGTRVVGLSEARVAGAMAALALLTCLVALGCGWTMQRRGWSADLLVKLRLALAVVIAQTALTALALGVRSEGAFWAWIAAASLALGGGVPVTFSLTVDFIPVRDRGYAAALITAGAYFAAAVYPAGWQVETLARQLLPLMVAGVVALAVLALRPPPFVARLARQHEQPAFGIGRFVRAAPPAARPARFGQPGRSTTPRHLVGLVLVMFGVYFIDSLGFLRLVATPVYMTTAWQSPDLGPRLLIGGVHVVTALSAGVLYAALDEKSLFLWILGVFALNHLMYIFDTRLASGDAAVLAMPMLYATAVSLYTVLNFALWADLSTPRTVSFNTALGVALSGWTATFLSTALAITWRLAGMPLAQHFSLVAALALLLFLALLLVYAFQPPRHEARL